MKEGTIIQNISERLKITELSEMQLKVAERYNSQRLMLLSPTGSGKTLAFSIAVLKNMKPPCGRIQAIVIAPSRELSIQIYNVVREIATNYKTTCCYGGHNFDDEKKSLTIIPDIIIGTPGRLLDHCKRQNIQLTDTRILVLDEFDKSLELGFHEEMEKLLKRMPNVSRRILTSATDMSELPGFIAGDYEKIDFLSVSDIKSRIEVNQVKSDNKDKLETLSTLLANLHNERAIVFVNYRDAVDRVFTFLKTNRFPVGIYHGGLEQLDREKAIALFSNGTFKILITTDLGARGLDIDDIKYIIHYHLPVSEEVYTHRNGRTARVDKTGAAFVITGPAEEIPNFIKFDKVFELQINAKIKYVKDVESIFFSAGRKEKISKADILGFLIAKCQLQASEIGKIFISDHYSLVAVPSNKSSQVVLLANKEKIKNKKIKISLAKQ